MKFFKTRIRNAFLLSAAYFTSCGTADCIEFTNGYFPFNNQDNMPLTSIFGPFVDPILKGDEGEISLVKMSDPPLFRMYTNETPLKPGAKYSIYYHSSYEIKFQTTQTVEVAENPPVPLIQNVSVKSQKILTFPYIFSEHVKYYCEDHRNADIVFDCPNEHVAGIFHCDKGYCSPLYRIDRDGEKCTSVIGAETFNGDNLNLQFLSIQGNASEVVATKIEFYY